MALRTVPFPQLSVQASVGPGPAAFPILTSPQTRVPAGRWILHTCFFHACDYACVFPCWEHCLPYFSGQPLHLTSSGSARLSPFGWPSLKRSPPNSTLDLSPNCVSRICCACHIMAAALCKLYSILLPGPTENRALPSSGPAEHGMGL